MYGQWGSPAFHDDISEMVLNIVPLFLANVLGVQTSIIGLIDGIAEAIASTLKLFSGWLSDKIGGRKWLAVAGYAISAISKPFFYIASSWELIGGVRWADRVGKGIRTAPRDALVADSVTPKTRGLAFGFNRALDKSGAVVGILIAALVVWLTQKNNIDLTKPTFQTIVLISLVPAFLAVISLSVGARDVEVKGQREAPRFSLRGMGKPFNIFLVIISVFTLGNSADSFLVLRAQNLGSLGDRHPGDAGGVQPGHCPGRHTRRVAIRPHRAAKVDRGGLAGVRSNLFRLRCCTDCLAGVDPLCDIRPILWNGIWHRQRHGCRSGSRASARHCLRYIQCHYWTPGFSRFVYCRHSLAGYWKLERVWTQCTFPVWRKPGVDRPRF